jgi:hypothetical protein
VERVWPGDGFETLGALGIVDPKAARSAATGNDGFDALVRRFGLMSAERWVRLHTSA